jgi:CHRD domain/PEP-CTERM motif
MRTNLRTTLLRPAVVLALSALALPASAAFITYHAHLTGAAESPPNASPGSGHGFVELDTVAMTMRVNAMFAGLLGNVTAAHIHCCTAVAGAGNVGVATMTPTFAGFPSGVTSGSYDQTFDMSLASSWNTSYINNNGGTPSAAFGVLSNGLAAGRAYLNIHSTQFGGGEIRGFLHVPEPTTPWLALAALGLAAAGTRAARRR